ncbi:MAG: hypothetical protein KDK66_05955, partial [Deltaproteobacteria bacterium]|nr:hypothetical protein [Deltaproteobacteria bacterium]
IHPKTLNAKSSKPDFLVAGNQGEEFYLEAVLATKTTKPSKGNPFIKGTLFDKLNEHPHKNFMVAIYEEGSPVKQPSGKRLVKDIHDWLDSLNPDEIQAQIESKGLKSISPFTWSHENWNLEIFPIPLIPNRRGQVTRLISIPGIEAGWVDKWSPIKKAIKSKGKKYGKLDKPLLIAINLDSFLLDRIDEMQALYGQEQYIFKSGSSDEPIMQRAPNGAWYGKSGPQYTRVSGAWIFNDLDAISLAKRKNTIYFNPWAEIPLPKSLRRFPHSISQGDKMQWVEGITLKEIFGLYEGWPEKIKVN